MCQHMSIQQTYCQEAGDVDQLQSDFIWSNGPEFWQKEDQLATN